VLLVSCWLVGMNGRRILIAQLLTAVYRLLSTAYCLLLSINRKAGNLARGFFGKTIHGGDA